MSRPRTSTTTSGPTSSSPGRGACACCARTEDGRFADVTKTAGIPQASPAADLRRLGRGRRHGRRPRRARRPLVKGPLVVLRNNGDGTFAEQRPFGDATGVRGFAWADLDGDGVPDAALLEPTARFASSSTCGAVRSARRRCPPGPAARRGPRRPREANGDSLLRRVDAHDRRRDRVALAPRRGRRDGSGRSSPRRIPASRASSRARRGSSWPTSTTTALPTCRGRGARPVPRPLGGTERDSFKPLAAPLPLRAQAAADLDGDGRLELVGRRAVAGGARPEPRDEGLPLAGAAAPRRHRHRRPAHQLLRHRRRGGAAHRAARAEAGRSPRPSSTSAWARPTRADVVRIIWPNGILQSEFDKPRRTPRSLATQRLKGSCPWLFAWNGREMAFVTDLIWRSPLGPAHQRPGDRRRADDRGLGEGARRPARAARRRLRPARHRRALGDALLRPALAPGRGPPAGHRGLRGRALRRAAAAAAASIVTGPVRELRAARDDRGPGRLGRRARARRPPPRLRRPRRLPGRHARPLRRAGAAGGGAAAAARSGSWRRAGCIPPTARSTSRIARARTRRPAASRSRWPTLPGASARFATGLGFPAGKDKTVLLDLTGLFPRRGPRRLRLATNLEIFWDRLGWAVGRPDVRARRRGALALASAELRYRGYSVTEQEDAELARAAALRARRHGAALAATSRATTRASATCASCWRGWTTAT